MAKCRNCILVLRSTFRNYDTVNGFKSSTLFAYVDPLLSAILRTLTYIYVLTHCQADGLQKLKVCLARCSVKLDRTASCSTQPVLHLYSGTRDGLTPAVQ